ncbi:MAG: Re/Si-specific NAD(P)(+) transhydrogenase subunit alpha [Arsenophonus sp. NC-WZS1-MAG3]
MHIGVPKERITNEARIAVTPLTVKQLIKLGFSVLLEREAGYLANFEDAAYEQAGAKIVEQQSAWNVDIIFKVNAPLEAEIVLLKEGSILICFIWPAQQPDLMQKLASRKITVLAMDAVPRISRAQSLDAISSMANVAGYRSVVEAAYQFGRFFTGQITAAGKVPPAKVMVIGAGVAGLAAIAAAGRLGAIVFAFDTRLEVREQVQSMGAKYLELDLKQEYLARNDVYPKEISEAFIQAEMFLLAKQVKEVDIIITTALIPGKPAPILITKEMVNSMKSGSVIVDLAAKSGGNCELTKADKLIVTDHEVKIIGYTDLPSRLPTQSSQFYATNIVNLIKLLCKESNGKLIIDFNDIIIRAVTVIKEGEITWPSPPIPLSQQPQIKNQLIKYKENLAEKKISFWLKYISLLLTIILFSSFAHIAPKEFLSHFTVFVLACIVGYYVVWNVSHSLYTPLMSVSNAISGIIVVGALLQIDSGGWVTFFSFIAVLIANINIFGGFTVTQRMLKMFRKG